LCIPLYTLYLLQPLDVACFSPLKRVYTTQIQQLVRQGIYHIEKDDFLAVYKHVRSAALSERNITSGFSATGLIPFNPQRVLAMLPIQTLSPPTTVVGEVPL
jgi:hypothetical protein